MQQLRKEFGKNERRLVQLRRSKHAALYAIYLEYTNVLYGYEVIRILTRPRERTPDGRVYPKREAYPGNEQWGKYGWSYGCDGLQRAERQFDGLVEAEEEELDRSEEL
jgi:hypothetical protein